MEKLHTIPCANVTSSGINLKCVVGRLVEEMEKLGRCDGPAISDRNGEIYSSVEIDQILKEILEEIFEEDPSLFPPILK